MQNISPNEKLERRAKRLAETLLQQNAHLEVFDVELFDENEASVVRSAIETLGHRAEIVVPGNRLRVYN